MLPEDEELLCLLCAGLPGKLRERCESVQAKELYVDRVISYTLLLYALESLGKNPEECEVLFTKLGKPYLKSQDMRFSISHTRGIVCVAISDSDIGVDAQSLDELSLERVGALSKRFFGDVYIESLDIPNYTDDTQSIVGGVKIEALSLTLCVKNAGVELIPTEVKYVSGIDGPMRKWCECESLLKLDGRGFSALGDITRIAVSSRVFSTCIKTADGALVHLSFAISK